MSSTGTRPPLFDPEPGSFENDVDSPRFPRKRSRGAKTDKQSSQLGDGSNSPAWVRPFIFGGLILVAVLSLFSFVGDQDPDTAPAAEQDQVGAQPAAAEVQPVAAAPAGNGQDGSAADAAPSAEIGAVAQEPVAQDAAPPAEADQPDGQQLDAADPPAASAAPAAFSETPSELQAASAFAVQFAHDYLNFDEANPEIRERELRSYLAPGLDGQLGWNGEGVQLAVLTIPVEAVTTESGVAITVAAQVTGKDSPRWIHLSVPLGTDDDGRWAVTGQPAYVPRPTVGAVKTGTDPSVDDALTEALQPGIDRFFAAFAEESTVQLEGITTADGAIRGLAGILTLDGVQQVQVFDGDDEQRTARARVAWQDEITGTTVDQTYTLTLVQQDDVWLIDQVGTG